MKSSTKLLSIPLLLTASLMVEIDLRAVTISYRDFERAGVNFSGSNPAIVPGVGLGIDGGVGPAGQLNTLLHYEAGQFSPESQQNEGRLWINVDGNLNSVTLALSLSIYNYSSGTWAEGRFERGDMAIHKDDIFAELGWAGMEFLVVE